MSEIIGKESFKHVSYLWDHAKAAELAGDEVALLLYRSNLLGADLRLPITGEAIPRARLSPKTHSPDLTQKSCGSRVQEGILVHSRAADWQRFT